MTLKFVPETRRTFIKYLDDKIQNKVIKLNILI